MKTGEKWKTFFFGVAIIITAQQTNNFLSNSKIQNFVLDHLSIIGKNAKVRITAVCKIPYFKFTPAGKNIQRVLNESHDRLDELREYLEIMKEIEDIAFRISQPCN
jgi:hypothetical protein